MSQRVALDFGTCLSLVGLGERNGSRGANDLGDTEPSTETDWIPEREIWPTNGRPGIPRAPGGLLKTCRKKHLVVGYIYKLAVYR